MFMIYFLAIILNIAFLIVFAILTYFESLLKGFLKLFFIRSLWNQLFYSFFFYLKKCKIKVEKEILVFYSFSAISVTAQALPSLIFTLRYKFTGDGTVLLHRGL